MQATAMHVPMSDVVIKDAYKSRLPRADDFWNVPKVFARSYKLFDTFNKFFTVTMPSRPQIAHWTYPLPLKSRARKTSTRSMISCRCACRIRRST